MQQPSVTETDGESAFGAHLSGVLAQIPYFAEYRSHVRLLPTEHDFRKRDNVFALVRGTGSRTVILAGHYDVVSTANFGPLEPFAHDPAALLPRMLAALQSEQRDDTLQQALDDLKTGDFMPGRGALDMKSGDAIGIALLERFASDPNRIGNVLFVCTPDEENYSHGMRSAMAQLPGLLTEFALEPALVVNLDSSGLVPDNAQEVFLGSVGKFMPFVHFVGRPTHVGDPFSGVSATLLAAELVREVECNPEYSDVAPTAGEMPPVPVALRAVDLKGHYDVTTPEHAFVAFNVLTFSSSAAQVLARMNTAAQRALHNAIARLREHATAASQPFGLSGAATHTFASLFATAAQAIGADALDAQLAAIAGDRTLDVLTATQRMTTALARAAGLAGPAAVIGFAPLFYPISALPETQRGSTLRILHDAARFAQAEIQIRPFFTGISDMSFLGARLDPDALTELASNTPGWVQRWNITPESVAGLGVPVLNIGPSGRDYHQRCERVHMPLSFEVAPKLIWHIVQHIFRD